MKGLKMIAITALIIAAGAQARVSNSNTSDFSLSGFLNKGIDKLNAKLGRGAETLNKVGELTDTATAMTNQFSQSRDQIKDLGARAKNLGTRTKDAAERLGLHQWGNTMLR